MRIRWNYGIMADASYGWKILKLTVKNLRIFTFHLVLILIMFNGKSVSSSRAKWTFQDGRSKASDRRMAVFSQSPDRPLYIFFHGVIEFAVSLNQRYLVYKCIFIKFSPGLYTTYDDIKMNLSSQAASELKKF